ncbi:MAG: DUF5106 domain-containing protein [Candidatus Pseudobacter hemicellulosilyticus]|uniref:DUF5106 domain-containing protein n=1 Tax=Candidatus Pseudobacter hemicellulosilyticus TaxID=3121375 RepID=A0AAJ6BHD5_9BACT|nr:MAG: DUF5106 domain-containing protein [Pseudobacter sp.]
MKKIVSLLTLLAIVLVTTAQTGYTIAVTVKPYKNDWVYLGYHYGKMKALTDSVKLDANSQGVFKGKEALPGGIYFIVSPRKEILFELLVDKQQHFSITADSAQLPNGIVFKGSADNSLFQQYTVFANKTGQAMAQGRAALATAKTAKDSAAIQTALQKNGDHMQSFRDSINHKHPESLLAALLQAMKEPVVPPAAKQPGGKYDSAFAYHYVKEHYWDGVEFNDGRLVRTPFFEIKLEKYYRDLVSPDPDSVIKEADYMLLYARSDKEMFKYLMVTFVQKYVNPQYMGQDAVFVHLFEKFINTGQTDFFTEEYKEFMTKRAYSIMANLIGRQGADLKMVDTLDKPATLYKVQAPLVVLCFWDPTCSHCKEVVPKVDSIFQASWKAKGVKVYGVMVEGGKDKWMDFIRTHNLKDWLHVYQLPADTDADAAAGRPGYRQLYDVFQTPILYLLDKDKRILAKKLDYLQLNEVINMKLQQPNTQ